MQHKTSHSEAASPPRHAGGFLQHERCQDTSTRLTNGHKANPTPQQPSTPADVSGCRDEVQRGCWRLTGQPCSERQGKACTKRHHHNGTGPAAGWGRHSLLHRAPAPEETAPQAQHRGRPAAWRAPRGRGTGTEPPQGRPGPAVSPWRRLSPRPAPSAEQWRVRVRVT